MKNHTRALVVAALLLGAACLRLVDLGSQGLFFDEAWSWAASRLSLAGLYHLSLSDPHPPLYYLLLKLVLLIVPSTPFGLRLLSAGLSLASLAILLGFVSSRWNIETTIYVGLLAGLSPFDIYYAQETRMYTLLAFLWVASYISLVKALHGDRKSLFLWPLFAILMAWTHFYGVIVAFVFVLYSWGARLGWFKSAAPRVGVWPLGIGAACVALGALPPLALALFNAPQDAGGAWIPAWRDLSALWMLCSAGLAPVRTYFLDSAHLVLPALAAVPASAWITASLAVAGLPAAWGLFSTWRAGKDKRAQMELAILLIVLPAALAFGYGAVTARRVWAFKPFLGAAILLYLWAGVGIGSIRWPLLRRSLGAAAILLALTSLWPYYATWQKSDAARALHSLPAQAAQQGLIIEPPYLSPLAFYYLGQAVPVYGLAAGQADAILPMAGRENERRLFRITPGNQDNLSQWQQITCDSLPSTVDLYVYGYLNYIRDSLRSWPACVTIRRLWVFQDNVWQPLK